MHNILVVDFLVGRECPLFYNYSFVIDAASNDGTGRHKNSSMRGMDPQMELFKLLRLLP